MARVKCVMMQRDEDLMLEPWLRYYGYLFGYENLTVFDNGSDLMDVRRVLARYAKAGVTVVESYATSGDWVAKGELFATLIRHWDRDFEYDFALPLDCDEFLTLFNGTGMTCSREAIQAHLDSLIGRQDVLGVASTLFNVPGRPGWFCPELWPKTFFAANTIYSLDHGFHAGRSSVSDETYRTRFSYLHFHYKPHAVALRHARQKLAPFVNVDDIEAMRDFRGAGHHLVPHFFQTEGEYRSQFDGRLTIGFAGLSNIMGALGIHSELFVMKPDAPSGSGTYTTVRIPAGPNEPTTSFVFDGGLYLERNFDVVAAGINPLEHYLFNGFKEQRAICDVRAAAPVVLGWEPVDVAGS